MITSNIRIENIEEEEKECPICGAINDEVQWEGVFWCYDPKKESDEIDVIYETYYHCDECGYFCRACDGDTKDNFLSHKVEGISIMQTQKKAYKQINLLRLHQKEADNYRLLDHRRYEPYLNK